MATVLVVDDDRTVRHMLKSALAEDDITVREVASAEDALDEIRRNLEPDAVVLDIVLPEISGLEAFRKIQALDHKLPVVFITAQGTSDTAIEAMKLGAYDYLAKPLDLLQVRKVVGQAIRIRQLMNVPVGVGNALTAEDMGDQIVGQSSQMQEVFKAIGRVAPQNVTVLIRGESGTGKELVARAIYQHSRRSEKPFLAVNCAAIPENLLESELFGHEKGSFTGADTRRIGKFEQCSGGTIFLDEVGDMPSMLQSKILRLLQEQRFERVGGNDTIKTDVRIIAATNRDLEVMVAKGQFREDLFYRLNGYTILLPPLRQRKEDVPMLLQHFLARIGKQIGKKVDQISPDALAIFKEYRWPGNVRELESVVRQSMLETTGNVIAPEFVPSTVRKGHGQERDGAGSLTSPDPASGEMSPDLPTFVSEQLAAETETLYADSLAIMEHFLLTRVLQHTNGNQSEAAKILGITRGSLRNKVRALEIELGELVGHDLDLAAGRTLDDLERTAVERALDECDQNRTRAAKVLGISVRTLQRKLKAWGIGDDAE